MVYAVCIAQLMQEGNSIWAIEEVNELIHYHQAPERFIIERV